jgi:hypothetical protein
VTDDPKFFAKLGEYLIAGALAFIAWVMKTFTSSHLETMRSIETKLAKMQEDVAVLKEHSTNTDDRLDRLEK